MMSQLANAHILFKATGLLTIIILALTGGLLWRRQQYHTPNVIVDRPYLPLIQHCIHFNTSETQHPMQEITYEALFKKIGDQYGIDWRILATQAYQESKFNPLAIGAGGEKGLMQIQPMTWEMWADRTSASDPFDPYHNVLVAAAYLDHWGRFLANLGHPEPYWPLVAYNWGPGNLRQFLATDSGWDQIPDTTRRYSLSIIRQSQNEVMPPLFWNQLQVKVKIRVPRQGLKSTSDSASRCSSF